MPTGPGNKSDVRQSNHRKSFSEIAGSLSQGVGAAFQLGSEDFIA